MISLYYIAMGGITGYLFHLFKIPGDLIVGSIVGTALLNLIVKTPFVMPLICRRSAECLLGISLGIGLSMQTISTLGSVLWFVILLVLISIFVGMLLGYLLFKLSKIDLTTGLFCGIPGATFEMASAAEEQGGNMAIVAAVQTMRTILVVALVPFILKAINSDAIVTATEMAVANHSAPLEHLGLIVIGAIGAFIGLKARIPGGAIIGAMIFIGTVNIAVYSFGSMDEKLMFITQILLGAVVGTCVNKETVIKIKSIIAPLTLILGLMLGMGLVLAYGFWQFSEMTLITAIFSFAPGGIAEMTATAEVLGGSGAVVAAVHLVRISMIVILAPILIKLVLSKAFSDHKTKASMK